MSNQTNTSGTDRARRAHITRRADAESKASGGYSASELKYHDTAYARIKKKVAETLAQRRKETGVVETSANRAILAAHVTRNADKAAAEANILTGKQYIIAKRRYDRLVKKNSVIRKTAPRPIAVAAKAPVAPAPNLDISALVSSVMAPSPLLPHPWSEEFEKTLPTNWDNEGSRYRQSYTRRYNTAMIKGATTAQALQCAREGISYDVLIKRTNAAAGITPTRGRPRIHPITSPQAEQLSLGIDTVAPVASRLSNDETTITPMNTMAALEALTATLVNHERHSALVSEYNRFIVATINGDTASKFPLLADVNRYDFTGMDADQTAAITMAAGLYVAKLKQNSLSASA